MPRGSAPGERRGGRQKGAQNKKTKLRAELLNAEIANGESPLAYMLRVMRQEISTALRKKHPVVALSYATMKFEAAKAAAPYIHAKPGPSTTPKESVEEYARKIREATEALDATVPGVTDK